MGGGHGLLCPVYCGRSDASGETAPPRTVYVPVACLPSTPQQGQIYQYPNVPQTHDRIKPVHGYPCIYSPSVPAPAQLASAHQQIPPGAAGGGYCPPADQPRLQVPSLPPRRHNRSLDALGSSVHKHYSGDLKDREDAVLAALLDKEAELQARIISKQRQLHDLRRQLHEVTVCNGYDRRRTNGETPKEVQQLRSNLCDREVELEKLRAEMDLMKKETTSLAEGKGLSREARINQPATGEQERQLSPVKSLREREEENRLLSRRLEALRDERRDLRELLVQKEQQLATALGSVDPACKESSALQLGMQAISMVQNNAGLKKQIQQLQAELTATREDHARKDLLLEDTLQKLDDKRKEAAGLLELVSQREMKIARVETFLQHRNKELEQLQEKARVAREQEAVRLQRAAEELRILEDQQTALKSIIASRDEKMLCLQNELVRRDAIIRQLEERSRTLAHDLEQSGNHVQQLIRSSAAKDAYMYELEAQLRQNEVQRQASYLAEVARTRHFALETRLKEDECRNALNEKDEELAAAQHDLSRRCNTLQQIRQAVSSIETADTCYRVSPLTYGASSTRKKERAVSVPPRSQTGISSGCAAAPAFSPSAAPLTLPQYPLEDSLKALQADFLLERSRSSFSAQLQNGGPLGASGSHQAQVGTPFHVGGAGGNGERPPTTKGLNEAGSGAPSLPSTYAALVGDPVDEAVGEVLRNPRYTPYAHIVHRLSPGKYLVGAAEVQLHIHPAHGLLAQTSDRPREWISFTAFLDALSSRHMLSPPLAPRPVAGANAGDAPQVPTRKMKGDAGLRTPTLKSKSSPPPKA